MWRITAHQPYAGAWNKFKRFFTFFGERLINKQITTHVSVNIAVLTDMHWLSLRLWCQHSWQLMIHSLIGQYQLFADISILPSLTSTSNYIWMFIRFVLFPRGVLPGFPSVSYGLKHVFQKRSTMLTTGCLKIRRNERFSDCVIAVATVMTFISHCMVISWNLDCILRAHSLTSWHSSSMFKSATESTIDPIYLSLIGLVVQLIITISLLLILF